MRHAIILLSVFTCLSVTTFSYAQSNSVKTLQPLTTDRLDYTDAELADYGLSSSELATYRARLNSRAGRWWGHLSPMELMMYSAESADERRRFAKLYLQSMHPKSLAERDAGVVMYQVARELQKEHVGLVPMPRTSSASTLRPALFVRLDCEACKKDVAELVATSDVKIDVYVTRLDPNQNAKTQLVSWARSMRLPPQKVTLNDDKGIYQKRFGKTLDRLQLVTQ